MARISLEFSDSETAATCSCCGRRSPSVVGWVYRDGDAYAAYYAGWTEGHSNGVVSLIIGVGEWSEDERPEDRRSFGLKCWEADDDIRFGVVNPADSRYGDVRVLGKMMSRTAALEDPAMPEIFHIAEHIAQDDPRVSAALASLRPEQPG
jgi:hypothetical protein